jgi:hypothetical protein
LKLIACIEGDEHTKFQMTKEAIVSLMNFVTVQCMAKLARLVVAEQEQEVISVDGEPNEQDNQPNEANEPKVHSSAISHNFLHKQKLHFF